MFENIQRYKKNHFIRKKYIIYSCKFEIVSVCVIVCVCLCKNMSMVVLDVKCRLCVYAQILIGPYFNPVNPWKESGHISFLGPVKVCP